MYIRTGIEALTLGEGLSCKHLTIEVGDSQYRVHECDGKLSVSLIDGYLKVNPVAGNSVNLSAELLK